MSLDYLRLTRATAESNVDRITRVKKDGVRSCIHTVGRVGRDKKNGLQPFYVRIFVNPRRNNGDLLSEDNGFLDETFGNEWEIVR